MKMNLPKWKFLERYSVSASLEGESQTMQYNLQLGNKIKKTVREHKEGILQCDLWKLLGVSSKDLARAIKPLIKNKSILRSYAKYKYSEAKVHNTTSTYLLIYNFEKEKMDNKKIREQIKIEKLKRDEQLFNEYMDYLKENVKC